MRKKAMVSVIIAAAVITSVFRPVYADNMTMGGYQAGPYDIRPADKAEVIVIPVDETAAEEYLPSIQPFSFFGNNTYDFYNILTQQQQATYDAIRRAVSTDSGAESCTVPLNDEYRDVSIFRNSYDKEVLAPAFACFVLDHPEYVGLQRYSTTASSIGGQIVGDVAVKFIYCSGQSAGTTARNSYNAVNNKVKFIADSASVYNNNYEKLKYFAEYLCDNTVYDYNAAYTGVGDNCWNAYGSFISGRGVCESYAEAFKLLCDAVSIPCTLAVSNTHEWNSVYLDGSWYYVDVTWMDKYEVNGKYDYSWFLTGTDHASDSDHVLSRSAVVSGVDMIRYPTVSRYPYEVTSSGETSETDQLISDFVERLYTTMLNRPSDPSGKSNWIGLLKNGTTAAAVSSRFVLSKELSDSKLTNREFVIRMYRTFMDREPDAGGLEHWIEILDNGCSYAYVLNRFVQSPEFNGICQRYNITAGSYESAEYRDKSPNLTAFISRMYTKALGRKYDVDGLNHWTGSYINKNLTINDISYKFILSPEFEKRNLSDEEFVTCMYATFFDRAPDPDGKAHWLNMLANGGTRKDVVAGFLRAEEFKKLVRSFGLSV